MSRVRITGRENVGSLPGFYLPNRLDLPTLRALDELLGGPSRLAFMVEEVLLPDPEVLEAVQAAFIGAHRRGGRLYFRI